MSDKTAHFWTYALLGALWLRALATGPVPGVTRRRFAIAALATALYGASDEIHQRFVPGRSPEGLDVAADAAGGVTGAALMAAASRQRRPRGGPPGEDRGSSVSTGP